MEKTRTYTISCSICDIQRSVEAPDAFAAYEVICQDGSGWSTTFDYREEYASPVGYVPYCPEHAD